MLVVLGVVQLLGLVVLHGILVPVRLKAKLDNVPADKLPSNGVMLFTRGKLLLEVSINRTFCK